MSNPLPGSGPELPPEPTAQGMARAQGWGAMLFTLLFGGLTLWMVLSRPEANGLSWTGLVVGSLLTVLELRRSVTGFMDLWDLKHVE